MKKLTILSMLILAAVACQSGSDDIESKKQLLAEKEKALSEIKEDIRKLKEEISEKDTIGITENKATPVRVEEVQPMNFAHFVELTGTVSSRENVLISAEAGGRVEIIPAKEGDKVKKGQVLVRIDNEAIGNQLEEAKAVYELAETTYLKRKNLWDQNIGSEIEYLQAKNNYETAKSRLAQVQSRYQNTIIKSPISGIVDNIAVNQGEFVGVGSPVARVVDLEQVEVEAELSEDYLASVRKGDSVRVRIPALGYEHKAVVNFVSQVINPDNRSFKIKVRLTNEEGIIKPNALANLSVRDYQNQEALVVPSSSIGRDLKGSYVFVAVSENGQTLARKKYITRGKSFGPDTEIKSGLTAGDKVITAGSDEVNEGEEIAVQ